MNKKHLNLIIIFLLFIFLFELFDHSNLVINTIYKSTSLWFYNLVPTILPIYITVDLLINYNALNYLNKLFGNFMIKFFKMKKETVSVFLLSIISGFPSNSKYIKNLLENQIINEKEASKLLLFTHFSNPLFIIESIGVLFLHNKKIGILILIIHYLTNFIIGFFTRNYYVNLESNSLYKIKNKTSFINCLTNSIHNTIKILFLLYGIITFFMIITTIIKANTSLSPYFTSLLCGLLEMTQGIYYLSSLSIPVSIKASLISFLISFGGLSIHMQVFSLLNNYKIKYQDYFLARIIHGLITSSLVFILIKFIN